MSLNMPPNFLKFFWYYPVWTTYVGCQIQFLVVRLVVAAGHYSDGRRAFGARYAGRTRYLQDVGEALAGHDLDLGSMGALFHCGHRVCVT